MAAREYYRAYAATSVAVLAMALALAAHADDATPPARNANIWNGIPHQPDRQSVASEEKKSGVALDQKQKAREDAELQNIQRNLLRQSQTPSK